MVLKLLKKLDRIVLEGIGFILNIKVLIDKKSYFTVGTTNQKNIQTIIEYYEKTIKGIKSLEYKIWARSFYKKFSKVDRF